MKTNRRGIARPARVLAAVAAGALFACGEEVPAPTVEQTPPAPATPADEAPVSRYVNGCEPETAVDRRGMAEVEIRFDDENEFRYVPNCVRISAGTRLTFVGNFMTHPFAVGRLGSEAAEPDPANPLRVTESGESATFVMDQSGSFPYFCNLHAWDGMMGAVFVERSEKGK